MSGGYILLSSCLTDSHGYHLKLGVLTSGSFSVSNSGNRKQAHALSPTLIPISRNINFPNSLSVFQDGREICASVPSTT